MRSVNESTKSLTYDTRCYRCGEMIPAGHPILYVASHNVNPALASGRNPRVFHVDRFCDKRKKNSSE